MKKKDAAGVCWCGCGGKAKGHFVQGHDRRATSQLLQILHGPRDTLVRFLTAHGYGPGGKNLTEEFEARRAAELAAWKGES